MTDYHTTYHTAKTIKHSTSRYSVVAIQWFLYWFVTVICTDCGTQSLRAQQQKATKPAAKQSEQPLELPEFVITGVEAIDVPGGRKQAPQRPPRLTAEELDRLNPLEKQPPRAIPAVRLPEINLAPQTLQGFVRGEFGMFITPALDAGYHMQAGGFDLYARAHGTYSQGHSTTHATGISRANNTPDRSTGFTDVGASLTTSYVAAEKFFFFGGSKTDSYIRGRHRSYQLFGSEAASAPQRSTLEAGGGVQTSGTFETVRYEMGASFEYMALSGNRFSDEASLLASRASPFATTNGLLRGFLAGSVPIEPSQKHGLRLGGRVNLDAQGFAARSAAQALSFLHAAATAQYDIAASTASSSSSSSVSSKASPAEARDAGSFAVISLELGAQHARNSADAVQGALAAALALDIHLSSSLTVRGGANTGLSPNAYQFLLRQNPYLDDSVLVDYTRSLYDVHLAVAFHPVSSFRASITGRMRSLERMPVFQARDFLPQTTTTPPTLGNASRASGDFTVRYVPATIVSAEAEALWRLSNADLLTLNATITSSQGEFLRTLPGGGSERIREALPYLPPLQASVSYRRQWSNSLSTTVHGVYSGTRTSIASADGQPLTYSLPSFLDVSVSAEYGITERLNVFLRGTNLLNQQILLWDAYVERGIFVAGGVQFQF
jgi:hypothetical protein